MCNATRGVRCSYNRKYIDNALMLAYTQCMVRIQYKDKLSDLMEGGSHET